MGTRLNAKKGAEVRYATRHLAIEKGKRSNQNKDMAPLRACKQLLKSEDWDKTKFSLIPKNSNKKVVESKNSSSKDLKTKRSRPKSREKVVIVSKKSSSVRVVKSGSQRSVKGIQRSVSVKKVSYSTSVIVSSEEEEDDDDESDSEDDDCDEDDDEDFEKSTKNSSHRRGTVIKHTTSKIKTNYCSTRKSDNRASKKAKALKLLREKSSNKKKSNATSYRELRPRFPYSPTQEWPTARAHRMASLNALAKVHVLYENEGQSRVTGEQEDNSLSEMLSEDLSSNDSKSSSVKDSKCLIKDKESGKVSKDKGSDTKSKPAKKTRKRKHPPDVEIIDTRICKRMASLNAQAILAASYVNEKPKKRERIKKIEKPQSSPETDVEFKEIILESSCNLQIVDSDKDQSPLHIDSSSQESLNNNDVEQLSLMSKKHKEESKTAIAKSSHSFKKQKEDSIELSQPSLSPSHDSNSIATTTVSEVGVTKYTHVTKVQINTTKEMAIKEESTAEKKIESILEKDDVAITRMYHYQSNTSSQSYSVRMETTYKPSTSRNFSSSSHQRSGPIPSPHVMGAVMPTRQSYYSYHNKPGVLASQSYPINRNLQPILGVDPHVASRYGTSAFTVPHYRHPHHMTYPQNEYSYYQPAGPLIQPNHDQYTPIHKPVPFHPHPSPLHSPQSSGSSSVTGRSREIYPSNDSYFSHHSLPSTSEVKSERSSRSDMTSSPHRTSHHTTAAQSFSRLSSHDATNASSSQRSSTQTYDSRSHTSGIASHMHGQYMSEKPDTYKYTAHNNPSNSRSPDRAPYSSGAQRDRSAYSASLHNPVSSYHTKSHNSREPVTLNQYSSLPVAQQHSVKNNIKVEPSKSHGKHHHHHLEHQSRDPNRKFCKNSESQVSADKIGKNKNLWRPPVVDVEKECESRNTKTYIELDVPKACPREKIVIVDVEKEEMKEQNIKKCDIGILPSLSSVQKKIMSHQI